MVDHVWVEENLDTYLAGDLTTKERENVERHVAGCEACTQALAEARRLEQVMNRLFADARPDANLDDRIIRDLSKEPARALQRPTLWRFAAAAAAVLVVGMVGAVVQAISTEGGLPFSQMEQAMLVRESPRILKRTDLVGGSLAENGSSLVAEFEKEIAEGKLKASDVIEFAESAMKIQEAGFGEKTPIAEDSGKPGDKKAPSGHSEVPAGDFRRLYDGYDPRKPKLKFDDAEKGKDPVMSFYARISSGKDGGSDGKDLTTNKTLEELMKATKGIRHLDKEKEEKLLPDPEGPKVKITDKPGLEHPRPENLLRPPAENTSVTHPLTPVKDAVLLAEAIPGARLRLLSDTAHLLPLENPQAVAEEVCRLLALDGSGGATFTKDVPPRKAASGLAWRRPREPRRRSRPHAGPS